MMSSSSFSSSPEDGSEPEPALIAVLPGDIFHSQILNRVDGSTLAAASCASTELRSLCLNDELWRRICNSNWPSTSDPRLSTVIAAFPAGYRSFYSDAFTVPHHPKPEEAAVAATTAEIISAVDIHFAGELIYSKVFATETVSSWFLNTPFILELLDTKETTAVTLPSGNFRGWEAQLRLSWILIDTHKKRAMNVASQSVLEVCRVPFAEDADTQLRFATVVSDSGGGDMVQCSVKVLCGGGEEGQRIRLRQVSFQIQDMEDKTLPGNECSWVLSRAMEGKRARRGGGAEKEEYEMFVKMKKVKKEGKLRREKRMEVTITVIEIALLIVIWHGLIWK